jgi:hypothetical protein
MDPPQGAIAFRQGFADDGIDRFHLDGSGGLREDRRRQTGSSRPAGHAPALVAGFVFLVFVVSCDSEAQITLRMRTVIREWTRVNLAIQR